MSNVAKNNGSTISFSEDDVYHLRSDMKWNIVEDFIYTTVWWLRTNLNPELVQVETVGYGGEEGRNTVVLYDGVEVFSSKQNWWSDDYELRYSKTLRNEIRQFLLEDRI